MDYQYHYSSAYEQFRIEAAADFYYWFSALARVDCIGESDKTTGLLTPERRRNEDGSETFMIAMPSSIWEKKVVWVTFFDDRIECHVEVTGKGALDRVYFFTGIQDEKVFASVPGFDYFIPGCSNFITKKVLFLNEFFSISQRNETTHWGHALSSGPLVYLFGKFDCERKIWCGLSVPKGKNVFDSFDFNYQSPEIKTTQDSILNTQSFSIHYAGHEVVDGDWKSPTLVIGFAPDKSAALTGYCRKLEEDGTIDRPEKANRMVSWHKRPIFCGWHEQCALGALKRRDDELSRASVEHPDYNGRECTQANHDRWMAILEQHQIPIGTIIIDAKWQKELGRFEVDTEKWPNLRGFIDRCHAKGQKVLLWLASWVGRDGVPDEWCIKVDGKAAAVDPTHPAYRKVMEDGIDYMLGSKPGQLDADGFKIDGTTIIPAGPRVENYGNVYGFELQHLYCKIIYDHSLAVKPDALISLFIANPYFRDVCDMVRLGDLYTTRGRPYDTMRDRADIVETAMKGKWIDTDGTFHFSVDENCVEELPHQLEFGIPCLYQAETLFQSRAFVKTQIRCFTDTDYARIRAVFERYEKNS